MVIPMSTYTKTYSLILYIFFDELFNIIIGERYLKLSELQSTITGYHDDNNIVKISQFKVTVPAC
jgi:hypothetical protein